MEASIIQFIRDNKDGLIEKWLKEIQAYRQEHRLQHMSNDRYDAMNEAFIRVLADSYVSEDNPLLHIENFANEQIQQGWPLQHLTKGLQVFKKVLIEELSQDKEIQSSPVNIYSEVQRWVDPVIDQLITLYTGSWEKVDTLQKLALKELTAPLIPVFEGISVMPLVGTIDTDRAKLIMENLLSGVIKFESQVVLIDITGVPVVDTMVAHHLIQASDAVRLVGSEAILVGIRPEIAQTIVNLGIQLGKFRTTSSLRKGMAEALAMTNRKIVDLKEGASDDE
ncbi:STAS domain-containing protein [Bacillus horti]|uniref:RsbT co-antagonist protein RsbR n=1 Tax=Caldalkalibacillus horti TaxID=77523 RepID=A0ABT9W4T2_9BACI|nr:STAS domain-containing protein [Bacillus horti]MDQ0168258.1 rsbT co-antagonist protein RsbR [Bacillus horti]